MGFSSWVQDLWNQSNMSMIHGLRKKACSEKGLDSTIDIAGHEGLVGLIELARKTIKP